MKDLEFLPEHHIRARSNQRLRLTRLWLLIVLTLSMVCFGVYSRARIALAEKRLEKAQDQLSFIDYKEQVATRLPMLKSEEKLYAAQRKLVASLEQRDGRSRLLADVCRCVPEQVVLTRLEIDRQDRVVEDRFAAARPAPAARGRTKPPKQTEPVDRIRIEGLAADDLSLARFLQNVNETEGFEQADLGFSKDATFRQKNVRVFSATFYARVGRPHPSVAGPLQAAAGRTP